MCQKLCRHPRVLDQDSVCIPKYFRGAWGQVAEIADRRCDNVQSGRQALVHQALINLFQLKRKRVIVRRFAGLGEKA